MRTYTSMVESTRGFSIRALTSDGGYNNGSFGSYNMEGVCARTP